MRIDRVSVENLCVHRNREETFTEGLIGVIGPNGSGKSTLVGAAYAAITNDFSRLGGKEAALRQGADNGAIEVEISHGGVTAIIRRQFGATNKHYLGIQGEGPLTKATEIEQRLRDWLELGRDPLDTYVFVDQWQVRNVFELTPSERTKTFARLCGTTSVEDCWNRTTPGDFNDDLAVSAADYTTWRNAPGFLAPLLTDYGVWRDNYGASLLPASANATVPEPTTFGLLLVASVGLLRRRRECAVWPCGRRASVLNTKSKCVSVPTRPFHPAV